MFRRRLLLPVLASCAWLAAFSTAPAQQTAPAQYPPYRPQQEARPQQITSRPGMSGYAAESQYPTSQSVQPPYLQTGNRPAGNRPAAGTPGGRVYQAGYNEPARPQHSGQNSAFNPAVPPDQRRPEHPRHEQPRAGQVNSFPGSLPRQPDESDTRQLPVLRISRDGQEAASDGDTTRRTTSASSGLWTSFASLAVLILLMLGGAKLWKRHGPRMGSVIPGEAVEVLGRRPVDARHSIVLVRLGSRILVLSAGTGGLQTLTELTDPVEVDFLAGQCRQQAAEGAVAQTFRSLFQLESLRGREQNAGTSAGRTADRTTNRSTAAEAETSSDPYLHSDYGSEGNQYTTSSSFEDIAGETEYSDDAVYHNPEEQLPHQSAGAPHPAAFSEEHHRSPSPNSEAILQRLRMHSLSGGASRAAADREADSGGRQYHEAG